MNTRLLLILITLLSCSGVYAQTPSSCAPPALLTSTYDNDVRDMALSRMYAIASPDTSLIEVPALHRDSVLSGLAAICNLGATLEADSVFRSYCIHSYPNGYIRRSLHVKVDTSFAWARQWAGLLNTTGNAPLDAFMALHGFTLSSYFCLSAHEYLNNFATITADHALNWKAFADSLALFPGVLYVDLQQSLVIGDNNRITYQRDAARNYTFYLGWGDCPSGCTSSKVWKYKVDDLCNVTLTSVTQGGPDPYPTPANCNLFPLTVKTAATQALSITTYPNPATDLLHVSATGGTGSCTYTLTDMCGRTLLSGIVSTAVTVRTTGLPAGIYILAVTDAGGQCRYEKVVKK